MQFLSKEGSYRKIVLLLVKERSRLGVYCIPPPMWGEGTFKHRFFPWEKQDDITKSQGSWWDLKVLVPKSFERSTLTYKVI